MFSLMAGRNARINGQLRRQNETAGLTAGLTSGLSGKFKHPATAVGSCSLQKTWRGFTNIYTVSVDISKKGSMADNYPADFLKNMLIWQLGLIKVLKRSAPHHAAWQVVCRNIIKL